MKEMDACLKFSLVKIIINNPQNCFPFPTMEKGQTFNSVSG